MQRHKEGNNGISGKLSSSVLMDYKTGKMKWKERSEVLDYEGLYMSYSQVLTLSYAQYI